MRMILKKIGTQIGKIYQSISGLLWFFVGGIFSAIYFNDNAINNACCKDTIISYNGWLVDSLNTGISDAIISVEGLDYVKTNELGYFKFDSLPIKTNNFFGYLPWVFKKKCPAVESNTMTIFNISLKNKSIPRISILIPYSQSDTNRVVIP